MSQKAIQKHLLTLLEDYRDFNSIPIGTKPIPTAVEFAKQVSKGYPCIYRAYDKTIDRQGTLQTWTDPSLVECVAFTWTKEDLISRIEQDIEIAVTPDGRADDLHVVPDRDEPVFLSPASIEMSMSDFLKKLSLADASSDSLASTAITTPPVYYLQSQNSNLTDTPLAALLKHIPQNFPFAEPILSEPEAINIWIGDSRSITSTHRDPYENLYLVLKGTKTFTLYPPVDEITLPTKRVLTGAYTYDVHSNNFSTTINGSTSKDAMSDRLPWVSVSPLLPREHIESEHPLYKHATPQTVSVHEGEILYLPSGWYHHVQQQCGTWDEDGSVAPCIAVNYWFDMDYDGEKYVTRQLIGRLVKEMYEE